MTAADPLHAPAAAILFASSECPHCAVFKPQFRSAARSTPSVLFVECDVDQDPAAKMAAARYGVSSLPTTILMRHGYPVGRIEGEAEAGVVTDRVRAVFADLIKAA